MRLLVFDGHPTLRRGQAIDLFHDTIDDNDPGPRTCEPCAEAVLDAADSPERPSHPPIWVLDSITSLAIYYGSRSAHSCRPPGTYSSWDGEDVEPDKVQKLDSVEHLDELSRVGRAVAKDVRVQDFGPFVTRRGNDHDG